MRIKSQTARDLILLSAYLDGELSQPDSQALLARLQKEPQLQSRLEDLQRTKLAAGSLPRLRAPRNYTLTPDMMTARSHKKSPLIAPLRLASTLAAFLLVALFGIEFLFTNGNLFRGQQAFAPAMEKAAAPIDEPEPEPLIIWGQSGKGGVEGRGGGDRVMSEAPVMVESMPAAASIEEDIAVEELISAYGSDDLAEEGLESLPEENHLPLTGLGIDTMEVMDAVEDHLILGINLEESGEIISSHRDTADVEPAQPDWQTVLRILQIILGAIALGGGLIWWLLQRRS